MYGLKGWVLPKVTLLFIGVTLSLPIATAKDEHQRSSVIRAETEGATSTRKPPKVQDASFQLSSSTAYSLELPLIATLDVVKLSPENVLYLPARRASAEEFTFADEAVRARPVERFGLQLPQPDRWSAIAATLALALFFFVRRLV